MDNNEQPKPEIQISSLSGLNFRLFEVGKIVMAVISAAGIMFAAVWKVGQYFEGLRNEISGLRGDIVNVKDEIKEQKGYNISLDGRVKALEVEIAVNKAVEKKLNRAKKDDQEEVR